MPSQVIVKRLELEQPARQSAELRGHKLSDFATGYGSRKTFSEAYCVKCSMVVGVDVRPQPNGIEIGGTAIALNCTE